MQQNGTSHPRRHYRSLFWPFVFIGVGLIWLLTSFNIIPAENLSILWQLWPVLLIIIGLDMIFGRLSPILGALIGLVAIAVVIGMLIAGPTLGIQPTGNFFGIPVISFSNADLKTERFTEPLEGATAAQVTLDLGAAPTTLYALTDSTNLLDATLAHYGNIEFRADGEQRKSIYLGSKGTFQVGINPENWNKVRWDIGLSPKTPLDLTIDAGSGHSDLDLSRLTLTTLTVDGGSGGGELRLPAGPNKYTARIETGSGSIAIRVADAAVADLDIHSGSARAKLTIGKNSSLGVDLSTGSGGASVELPADSAARLEVRGSGSGSVHVASRLKLVDNLRDDNDDTGIWETANYAAADSKIAILVTDMGSGSIEVR